MTQTTQRTVKLGVRPGNTSDVAPSETVVFAGGTDTDGVDTLHDVYPETGRIEASTPGARLHFLGFADTVEGNPAIPLIPAVTATTGILPPYENFLGAADFTFADGDTFTASARSDETNPQFFAFYLSIGTGPSGLLWETGDSTDGAYVGFVNGKLVVRNGTGADLRVDASQLEGQVGRLCVHFDPANGQVQAWWAEEDTAQFIYLGTSSGTIGNWHDLGDGGAYHAAQNVSANIEAGGGGTIATASDRHTNTYSSSFSANMPSHTADDMLVACVSMHPYGGNDLVNASVAGWDRILDHDGQAGSYAPTMQVFVKKATSSSEKCQVTCSGATKNWEKTVIVMEIDDCERVTATLGDVQNGGNSTIDFPAAVGSPDLVLHAYAASVKSNLTVPSGETLVEESESYPRTQLWSDAGTTTTAVTGHAIETYPAHTSLTLNCFESASNEGTVAPSNFTVSAVTGPSNGPDADTWENQAVPANMMDLGTIVDTGTAEIPAVDATPFTVGSSDTAYSEITAGSYLESVQIRLKQTRTAAGLWTARLAAIDDEGFYHYGAPLRPPFDVSTTGEPEDRLLTKQSSFGNGTSVDAAISAGWSFGVLLESITEDNESEFGFAKLDVAELVFNFIEPPLATILFPVAGGTIPTVTPQIGWSVNAVDEEQNQVSYRVRVWETASFDVADTDGGRIAFDSGLIFSRSERAHQVSRPLRPDISYTVGVQLEGEALSGRRVLADWVTADFQTPVPLIDFDVNGQDTVTVTPTSEGAVDITAATFTEAVGSWAMIERARVADLDAAAAADSEDESYVALETVWDQAQGWEADVASGEIAPTADDGVLTVEARGTWWELEDTTTQFMFSYGYTTALEGGVTMYSNSGAGDLTISLQDETAERAVECGLTELNTVFTVGKDFWFRAVWDLTLTTDAVTWESTTDGVTWTQFNLTNAPAVITGPDTIPNADTAIIGARGGFAGWPGLLRKVKITNTGLGADRVIVDVDIDRDTAGDETVTTFTSALGRVFAPPTTIGGAELVRRGPNPAGADPRISVTGGVYNVGNDQGISTTGLPARVTGADLGGDVGVEWWGMLIDNGYDRFLMEWTHSDNTTLFRWEYRVPGTIRWVLLNAADQYIVYQTPANVMDPYMGRWIGLRSMTDFLGNGSTMSTTYITTDDGATWEHLDTDTIPSGTATPPLTVDMPDAGGTIYSMMGLAANTHGPGRMEKLRMWSMPDNDMILDVDLARDNPLMADTFIDTLGMTWNVGVDSNLETRGAKRTIPQAQVDDLWLPVVGLRGQQVVPPYTGGGPRMSFTDPAPPQHEEIAYRVRVIDEPAPTFESTSTEWVESAPVSVETDTWWLSTLSADKRFALEPSDAGWVQDRPGTIASGVGRSLHVTTKDVLKSREINVEVLTKTQTELDDLRTVLDTGETLIMSDVHGRSTLVEPTGQVGTTQVRSAAYGGETAPVGRTYATTFTLVEVEDPRDFGYGTNLKDI